MQDYSLEDFMASQPDAVDTSDPIDPNTPALDSDLDIQDSADTKDEPITPVATEPEPSTDPAPSLEGDDDDSALVNYYNFLKEQNYLELPEDFEFDGTPEGLQEALDLNRQTIYQKTAEAYFNALPDKFKPVLQYALAGGTDVDQFLQLHTSQSFEHLDPARPEDQKALLYQYYKATTNHDDAKIGRLIARLNEDDMREAAEESKTDLIALHADRQLKALEDAEAQRAANAQVAAQRVDELKNAIDSTQLVDNTVRSKVKGLFFNRLNAGKGETTEFDYFMSNVFSNPEHLAQLGTFFIDYDVKKGFSTKRFEQKGTKKANESFNNLLATHLGKPKASHVDTTSKEAFTLEQFVANI